MRHLSALRCSVGFMKDVAIFTNESIAILSLGIVCWVYYYKVSGYPSDQVWTGLQWWPLDVSSRRWVSQVPVGGRITYYWHLAVITGDRLKLVHWWYPSPTQPVLTPSGGHWNTYGCQAGCTHCTGMLSCYCRCRLGRTTFVWSTENRFCVDCNDTICLECLTDRHNRHTVQVKINLHKTKATSLTNLLLLFPDHINSRQNRKLSLLSKRKTFCLIFFDSPKLWENSFYQ